MKKIYSSIFAVLIAVGASAQAVDFTVIDTQGNTLSLFSTLATGKTIMLDFFFTTCPPCIANTGNIEHIYEEFGAGAGNFDIWGISDRDSDAEVNAYKVQYGVTNPCVNGTQGNPIVGSYSGNYNFSGMPTYAIVCADQSVTWDIWPISTDAPEIKDALETDCGLQASGIEDLEKIQVGSIYPNPANDFAIVQYNLTDRAKISLEVYNILGGLVKTVTPGTINAGKKQTQLNVKDLTNGNYFVKVLINNEIAQVMKLNVLK